ncbi:hypothetical protein HDU93_009415, partial [Gonapodya sp. JEL0774]
RIADPGPAAHVTAILFPFTSLPPELQQHVGRYWNYYPSGLPTGALSRQLRETLGGPVDVARRAVARFTSPPEALLKECCRDTEDTTVMQILIDRCDAKAGELRNSLLHVCCFGDTERLRLLLAAGAGIHPSSPDLPAHPPRQRGDYCGWTTKKIYETVAEEVLEGESWANLHLDDYPFQVACRYGHVDVVKMLMEAGLQLSTITGAAMRAAAFNGHVDVIGFLIERKCGFLEEALWAACVHGQKPVVELLLSRGVELRGSRAHDALIGAVTHDHVEIEQLLYDTGSDFGFEFEPYVPPAEG